LIKKKSQWNKKKKKRKMDLVFRAARDLFGGAQLAEARQLRRDVVTTRNKIRKRKKEDFGAAQPMQRLSLDKLLSFEFGQMVEKPKTIPYGAWEIKWDEGGDGTLEVTTFKDGGEIDSIDDRPAQIHYRPDGSVKDMSHYDDDTLHRLYPRPAFVKFDADGSVVEEKFFLNDTVYPGGKDDPAFIADSLALAGDRGKDWDE
jgi:hypothetical protein